MFCANDIKYMHWDSEKFKTARIFSVERVQDRDGECAICDNDDAKKMKNDTQQKNTNNTLTLKMARRKDITTVSERKVSEEHREQGCNVNTHFYNPN